MNNIREQVAKTIFTWDVQEIPESPRKPTWDRDANKDYYCGMADALLEAFPQLAEPVEYEYGYTTKWMNVKSPSEKHAYEEAAIHRLRIKTGTITGSLKHEGIVIRRRKAGKWEEAE